MARYIITETYPSRFDGFDAPIEWTTRQAHPHVFENLELAAHLCGRNDDGEAFYSVKEIAPDGRWLDVRQPVAPLLDSEIPF